MSHLSPIIAYRLKNNKVKTKHTVPKPFSKASRHVLRACSWGSDWKHRLQKGERQLHSRNAAPHTPRPEGIFRDPAARDAAALGGAGPARPAAPCDLGLTVCSGLDHTQESSGNWSSRTPLWPLWEHSPGQRCVCLVPQQASGHWKRPCDLPGRGGGGVRNERSRKPLQEARILILL